MTPIHLVSQEWSAVAVRSVMVLAIAAVVTALTAAHGGVVGAVPSAAQIFVTDDGNSRIGTPSLLHME